MSKPDQTETKAVSKLRAEGSGRAVAMVDLDRHTLDWKGDGISNLLGFEKNKLQIGLEDVTHLVDKEDQHIFQNAWARMLHGHPFHLECRLLDHAGNPRWILISATQGSAPRTMLLTLEDVDNRRRSIDAFLDQRLELGLASMAAGIAHEFNNLLTPVRGFIEISLEKLGHDHPVSAGLTTALSQMDRCGELMEMIQHSGRKSVLHRRRSDLRTVLTPTLRMATSLSSPPRHVTFENNIPDGLPEVYIDQSSIRLAAIHLFRNAVAALPAGGCVKVSAEVLPPENQSQKDADFILLSVKDHGLGIRKEDLAFIFDPFFTTHSRSEARGLGLSMVQGIAEQHGGWVQVHSQPGQGTEVRVFLPTLNAEPHRGEETVGLTRTHSVHRAIVCSNSKATRILAGKVFHEMNWRIAETHSLAETFELLTLEPGRHELLCLDSATCPRGMDDELKKVLGLLSHPRLIVLNSTGREGCWKSTTKQLVAVFAGNPFSPRKLQKAVEQFWPALVKAG